MTNFVDDNTALWNNKFDVNPITIADQQWGSADALLAKNALQDIRTVIRRSVDVRQYGAVGDGTANDGPAIQAAIDAAAAVDASGTSGGFVDLPKGTYLINQQLILKPGVGLRGQGPPATIIKAKSSFSAASMIANQNQTGGQEYAFLEALTVEASRGSGAVCTEAAVSWGSLFITSYIRDVVILDSSSVGLHVFAQGSPGGMGPIFFENVWIAHTSGHGMLIEEKAGTVNTCAGIQCTGLWIENWGDNCSGLYLKGLGKSEQYNFTGVHMEHASGATGLTGITVDGVSDVQINGYQLQAGAAANYTQGVLITSAVQNTRFQLRGLVNINLVDPVLVNELTGETINVAVGRSALPIYTTSDVSWQGAPRFLPASGGKSIVLQDNNAVDRVWWLSNGNQAGASSNGSSINVLGDATNNRPITVENNAGGNVFGLAYPAASGGVLELQYITGGSAIMRFGTDGSLRHTSSKIGFFNTAPGTKPTITGSRGGNAALASLLTALAGLGLITDSTTA